MKIAVIGIGGVGGYFGGRLTHTEHEVYFLARGAHLAAIQQHGGLQVYSTKGDFVATPTLATNSPHAIGPVDCVLVATKTWQVEATLPTLLPLVGPETFFVPLLNGVEATQQLADAFGAERVLGGFCRVLSWIESAGHIRQNGGDPFVAFGELDGHPSERVAQLKAAFDAANVTCDTPDDIQAAIWQKFLFIASFGGVGAVTRMPAEAIRGLPQTRGMIESAMQEINQVAIGRGIRMASDAVAKGMATVDHMPNDATASMQRDIMGGKPSELEAQNGAVVRLGAEVGIATPTHQFLYHALLPMELKARE